VSKLTVKYGSHHNQVADVWRPTGFPGDRPVVVLIHGGFWRQLYTKRLMHGMASAIVDLGWVAYNIEYRRVGALGSGGWPATFQDVAAAMDALDTVENIDLSRIITCGHSAGGHLALWAAGDRVTDVSEQSARVKPALAVSLAGVVDLIAAARMGLGGGAVQGLMGGEPDEYPDRYRLGSPAELLPLGTPQVLLHGVNDVSVPRSLSIEYVQRAQQLGDEATYLPLRDTDHMEMINPKGQAFAHLVDYMHRMT
jgi:acetyl esterase/lipase